MSRNSIILILGAVVAIAAAGGGKYIGYAFLAIAAPVYALLLASIFLMVFIVVASISVPIGRVVLDRREVTVTGPSIAAMDEDERRRAA